MDFFTVYNKLELDHFVPSDPGDPEVHKYGSRSDLNGHIEVYDLGVDYDIRDYIQSWKDSVDIELLIKRFKAGEQDALDRIKGVYGNFVDMPKNLVDMYNRIEEGKEFFNSLDPKLRSEFNNNPLEFFAQFGSDSFNAKVEEFSKNNKPIEQTEYSKYVDNEEK